MYSIKVYQRLHPIVAKSFAGLFIAKNIKTSFQISLETLMGGVIPRINLL